MIRSDDLQTVLTLNCGSSSLKFAVFRYGAHALEPFIAGEAEGIGAANGRFTARVEGREIASETRPIARHEDAATRLFELLARTRAPSPGAIGHRIVHGGPWVREHCLIDPAVFKALERAQAFAPLHAPAALAALAAAQRQFPDRPHVACLDTAFHQHMPEVARRFPLSAGLREKGIERYGFHGLSCESILRRLGASAPDRIVIAHLGGGSSVTAVKAGRSIDTSMGLTPTGGVMMATRTGDLDPGLLVYLIRELGVDAAALERLVDREGGLAGVSGMTGDMRQLRAAAESGDAALAIDMFVYSVRKQIAAMGAALGGLDLLVFTGGIGEHDAKTRSEIRAGLAWLGVTAGSSKSGERARLRGPRRSSVEVRTMPADEEAQIARHAWALAAQAEAPRPAS